MGNPSVSNGQDTHFLPTDFTDRYGLANINPNGNPGLYLIELETEKLIYLPQPSINTLNTNASFSPDGNWVIFENTSKDPDQKGIYLTDLRDLSTIDTKKITNSGFKPEWTIQGNQIILQTNEGILIHDLESTNEISIPIINFRLSTGIDTTKDGRILVSYITQGETTDKTVVIDFFDGLEYTKTELSVIGAGATWVSNNSFVTFVDPILTAFDETYADAGGIYQHTFSADGSLTTAPLILDESLYRIVNYDNGRLFYLISLDGGTHQLVEYDLLTKEVINIIDTPAYSCSINVEVFKGGESKFSWQDWYHEGEGDGYERHLYIGDFVHGPENVTDGNLY